MFSQTEMKKFCFEFFLERCRVIQSNSPRDFYILTIAMILNLAIFKSII